MEVTPTGQPAYTVAQQTHRVKKAISEFHNDSYIKCYSSIFFLLRGLR